jgi:hypothetical protein
MLMPTLELSDPTEPLIIPVTLVASIKAGSADRPELPEGSAIGIVD